MTGFPIRTAQRGFSYVEVLVAVLIVAIALPPALEALYAATEAASAQEAQIAELYRLSGRMEQVLADSFAALDAAALAAGSPAAPTGYSDPAGTPGRLLVFLAHYDLDDADGDGDPFSGAEAGLLWVRVAVENGTSVLESVTAP